MKITVEQKAKRVFDRYEVKVGGEYFGSADDQVRLLILLEEARAYRKAYQEVQEMQPIEFEAKSYKDEMVKKTVALTDHYGKKHCTGDFILNYWDREKRESVTEEMTLQQTFEHLNNYGRPFHIEAKTIDSRYGGKTFANILSRWDEEQEIHYYVIAQLQGSYIAKER